MVPKSVITKKHPSYDTWAAEWKLIADSFNGGSDFIKTEYLKKHIFESDDEYKIRASRAFYVNFVRRVVTGLSDIIFNEGVIRDGYDSVLPFITDATGANSPFSAFMSDVATLAALFGQVFIFVDYSQQQSPFSGTATQVSLENGSVFPIVEVFTPLDLTNWRFVKRHGYEFCVFRRFRIVDGVRKDGYLAVDYESITEVDSAGELIPGTTEYRHNLGYTPVFSIDFPSVYQADYQCGVGRDLAYVARTVLNWGSVMDEMIERHAFSQLTYPDDGQIEEMAAKQSDFHGADEIAEEHRKSGYDNVLVKVARSQLLTFPSNTGHPPDFISPDVSQLGTVWQNLNGLITLATFAAGLTDREGEPDAASVLARLKKFAMSLQIVEQRVLRTVARYVNLVVDQGVVIYPTAFSLDAVENWLNLIGKITNTAVTDAARNTMLRAMMTTCPLPGNQVEKATLADQLLVQPSQPTTPQEP